MLYGTEIISSILKPHAVILLSKLGYDYDNMREDGIAYPVATMDLKFMKPCTFNQKLRIVSYVEELSRA